MSVRRTVEPRYASTAGMFGAASIVTGIFSGIGLSYAMPALVSRCDILTIPYRWCIVSRWVLLNSIPTEIG